jgi:hypothetical protein
VGSASAAVIEHWWNISRALANPDGVCPFQHIDIGLMKVIRKISNRCKWIMAVCPFLYSPISIPFVE